MSLTRVLCWTIAGVILWVPGNAAAQQLALKQTLLNPEANPNPFCDGAPVFCGDRFGDAVAIANGQVFVSAPRTPDVQEGTVFQFDLDGTLVRVHRDPNPISEGHAGSFGSALAAEGERLLVGDTWDNSVGVSFAGGAYLLDVATGALLNTFYEPTPVPNANFGSAVALSGDDVIVGAWRAPDEIGRAYVFDATTGGLVHALLNPSPDVGDRFGYAVAAAAGLVAVGAPFDDTAGSNTGAVYVFDAATGDLVRTLFDPHPNNDAVFGLSLAAEGNRLLVGAPNDNITGFPLGSGFLYDLTSGAFLQQFVAPPNVGSTGWTAALSGQRVMLGAPFSGPGRALVYDAGSGALLATLTDPSPEEGDQFGLAVATDGDQVVVGAPMDDTVALNAGAAHVFGPAFLRVAIDIKPGSDPNSINLGAAGVIPVAILGAESFDAPALVDPETLFLAGARVRVAGKSGRYQCNAQNVNGDQFTDLVCHFENALNAQEGESIATMEGQTVDGRAIRGEDSIRIVP